jgi:predicted Zn-dependent peptidase
MGYQKTVLSNGVRIVSEGIAHVPSVSLGIWVNTGSRDETERENGVSHFIEHMIFKGTRDRDALQIAKDLDAVGGLSNAFTGKENTCFHARVLEKDFGRLVDILSDIFLHSTFSNTDLELERQVILREILSVEDCPDDYVHDLFHRLFWADHPIGMPVLGTGETIAAIRRQGILEYMRRTYVPSQILVAAAGQVDHGRLVSAFEPLLSPLDGTGARDILPRPRVNAAYQVYPKKLEQVHICLGGEAPGLGSEERFASGLLNTILGGNMSSRLFQEIREKRGLAYAVYSFLSSYRDTGMLGIYVGTDPGNVNAVLETVAYEIARIVRGDLSDSDLTAAKDHVVGGIYLGSESMDNRMMRLAKNELVFGRHLGVEEIIGRLERISLDDVKAAAEAVFQTGKTSLVTLGPFEEADLQKGIFP